ncbi:unnamed protein product [Paramecium sonneborni]|uniref:Uncharacterized protein n=1 Tax=Paramecium sonneborni TaxID=65129 RepID=A0A8S1RR57_9CILI|nr:unnamed protein product [Paramecium sonneborni]
MDVQKPDINQYVENQCKYIKNYIYRINIHGTNQECDIDLKQQYYFSSSNLNEYYQLIISRELIL